MTPAELAEVVQLVRAVARAEVMPRFRNLVAGDIQTKSGPLDMVTVADEAAELRLTTGLARLFPGCTVVGEEAASRDPSLLQAIAGAALCFILDPIDGTANFCAGLPLFGVMVAAVRYGRVVGAVIHDPVGDDTAVAGLGMGAWIEAAGTQTPMRVAAPVGLSAMAGTVSWRYMPEPRRDYVCTRLPLVGAAWDYRCAAHQYRMLAGGHCHYAVYGRLLPWDHAAGVLLHQEAGGYSARLDGSAYSPSMFDGGLICTPDRESWEQLRATLFEA
ncbi:MAG: inositol monophosphatase family protein [Acetobacteraceae bacterium]